MFRRPALPLLAAWIAGILWLGSAPFWSLLLLILAAGGLSVLRSRSSGLAVLVALAAAAGLRTWQCDRISPRDLSAMVPPPTSDSPLVRGPEVEIEGKVASDIEQTPGRMQFPLAVDSVTANGHKAGATGFCEVKVYAAHARSRWNNASLRWPRVEYGARASVHGWLRTPRRAGNPGEYDDSSALARLGVRSEIVARIGGKGDRDAPVMETEPPGLTMRGQAFRLKHRLEAGLASTLPPLQASLAASLLFAEPGRIPDDVRDAFASTGTIHLLATSGIHVAALLLGLAWMLRRWNGSDRMKAAILVAFAVSYALLTGFRPAAIRALAMAGMAAGADVVDREADAANLLFIAALGILIASPLELFDPGFGLSFCAVAGLIGLTRPIQSAWKPGHSAAALPEAFAAILAVTAAVTPLSALVLGEISPISPLANLFAVPLAELMMPVLLVHSVLAAVWPPLAAAPAVVTSAMFTGLTAGVGLFASVPEGRIYIAPPTPIALLTAYGLLVMSARPWSLRLPDP